MRAPIDTLRAFRELRHWMGMDDTRALLVYGDADRVPRTAQNKHPVFLCGIGDWQALGVPDERGALRHWLQRRLEEWQRTPIHRHRTLLQPLVWDNHYTVLVVPDGPALPGDGPDPHPRPGDG